jgi:BirA family biotin operon repressor/biotin-[acetyl-CoA-carboxylase] ligase
METLFIGRQRFEEEELLSTNAFAQELLRSGHALEGAIVITRNQKAGRGQRGNTWESEQGKNLTLSLVLMPSFLSVSEQFELTKISSLAVLECIRAFLPKTKLPISIKWPNDIYVGEEKIAGILIENVLRDNKINGSIVGVGLNVNQHDFMTTASATSLKIVRNEELDLRSVEESLCEFFEIRYLQLRAGKKDKINQEYLAVLYRLNEAHWFSSPSGAKFIAVIRDVSNEGKLRMELNTGELKEFDLKELKFEK